MSDYAVCSVHGTMPCGCSLEIKRPQNTSYSYQMFCDCSNGFGCEKCNLRIKELMENQRKYLPTLAELIDRLSITQLKEVFIPDHREEYSQEIKDIMHDIDLILKEAVYDKEGNVDRHVLHSAKIDARFIRSLIVLAQMNLHIWHNESNFRKGIKDRNDLELTHGLNGIRNTAKNRIQEIVGGRKDYKVDNVEAFKQWVPSWDDE